MGAEKRSLCRTSWPLPGVPGPWLVPCSRGQQHATTFWQLLALACLHTRFTRSFVRPCGHQASPSRVHFQCAFLTKPAKPLPYRTSHPPPQAARCGRPARSSIGPFTHAALVTRQTSWHLDCFLCHQPQGNSKIKKKNRCLRVSSLLTLLFGTYFGRLDFILVASFPPGRPGHTTQYTLGRGSGLNLVPVVQVPSSKCQPLLL